MSARDLFDQEESFKSLLFNHRQVAQDNGDEDDDDRIITKTGG